MGLDCGGSSTRVLAIDENGKAVFRGQSGPANLLSTPESQVRINLRLAAQKCPKATSVLGCFAGLIDEQTKARALSYLKNVFPGAKKMDAQPDFVAALAACGKDADACVIAGTGSIICSWSDGKVIKSGGRGPILGDAGSASSVGRGMLNVYLDDPSAASTSLKRAVQEAFGTSNDREIISRLYADSSPAAMLAKLGKAAAKESASGLEFATKIIDSEMAGLCKLVARHMKGSQFQRNSGRIGLAGGLWKSGPVYKTVFENCLAAEIPDMEFELFILKRAPVEGAAMLAREATVVN